MTWGSGDRRVLVFTVVLISCLHVTIVSPQVIDCTRLIMRVAKGILRQYNQCSKELLLQLNSNLDEFIRRTSCAMKCVMLRVGVLNEHYTVTNDTMQVFFDKYIPEDYHEIGHIMIEGCLEEYAPLMNNEDELCKAYGDFVSCVQNVVAEAC